MNSEEIKGFRPLAMPKDYTPLRGKYARWQNEPNDELPEKFKRFTDEGYERFKNAVWQLALSKSDDPELIAGWFLDILYSPDSEIGVSIPDYNNLVEVEFKDSCLGYSITVDLENKTAKES